MAATQPEFIAEYRAGSVAAHNASCKDGAGNATHTAVKHWIRFTVLALKINCLRPLDAVTTTLATKLAEVDLVEAFAWWLVKHVRCNTESGWSYTTTVNSWHHRSTGVHLAAGFPLIRVKNMLDGMQRLTGAPIPRLRRVGVRPAHLSEGIKAAYTIPSDKLHANFQALLETGLVALARACEIASGLPRGTFDPKRHARRCDVVFRLNDRKEPVHCMLYIVNSKAKGAEALRRLPVPIPMNGKYLSPGLRLWNLIKIIDPVPASEMTTTPLFRDPATNKPITVAEVREEIRMLMTRIGRDGSIYGAHSLRIGGATALSFLGAPPQHIKCHGRWRSDAYLRYIREMETQCMFYTGGIFGADVDDYEADHLDFECHDLDESDME